MKRFLIKCMLYSTPIIVYLAMAVIIDPFNIITDEDNPGLIELKEKISYKINYPLYILQEYSNSPTDIVLLGDSRTNKLKSSSFSHSTQMNAMNLAYGGGTLSEIIETFWYTAKIHDVKQYYIGINFNLYNTFNNNNRVIEAIELKESPASYLFSKYCIKALFLMSKLLLTNEEIDIERPDLNKEEFWSYQLEISARNYYRAYKYPDRFYEQLAEISNYCHKNNIKLVFFIPPTHVDLQETVQDFNLGKMELKFKEDISGLGTLYDFDYPNEITTNYSNFTDPFHCQDSIAQIVIREITTGDVKFAQTHNKI